jgi:hypothetical protein
MGTDQHGHGARRMKPSKGKIIAMRHGEDKRLIFE